MDATELEVVKTEHAKWVIDPSTGTSANLRGADLHEADLREANLDYSCWDLSCKTNHVKVDRKIAAQLAAHFCVLICDDPDYIKARDAVMEFAKTSHRAKDLGLAK